MDLKFKGQPCVFIIGSDVQRDGLFIEVDAPDQQNAILEIFHSDQTNDIVVTAFVQDIPLEVVEAAIAMAHKHLPLAVR